MAVPSVELLSNPVFRTYLGCCSVLVLKMLFMSGYTGYWRQKTKAFANPEDAVRIKGKVKTDDNVERVRRAHLNDLENIPLFFIMAYIYSLTNPSVQVARSLFWAYTGARCVHTFVYAIFPVPQPARALAFGVGLGITGYMAVTSLLYLTSL